MFRPKKSHTVVGFTTPTLVFLFCANSSSHIWPNVKLGPVLLVQPERDRARNTSLYLALYFSGGAIELMFAIGSPLSPHSGVLSVSIHNRWLALSTEF